MGEARGRETEGKKGGPSNRLLCPYPPHPNRAVQDIRYDALFVKNRKAGGGGGGRASFCLLSRTGTHVTCV